jgi:hypothetical protein
VNRALTPASNVKFGKGALSAAPKMYPIGGSTIQ